MKHRKMRWVVGALFIWAGMFGSFSDQAVGANSIPREDAEKPPAIVPDAGSVPAGDAEKPPAITPDAGVVPRGDAEVLPNIRPDASASCSYNGSITWGQGCSASVKTIVLHGDVLEVGSQSNSWSGSTYYRCDNGIWFGLNDSVCRPVAATVDTTTGAPNNATDLALDLSCVDNENACAATKCTYEHCNNRCGVRVWGTKDCSAEASATGTASGSASTTTTTTGSSLATTGVGLAPGATGTTTGATGTGAPAMAAGAGGGTCTGFCEPGGCTGSGKTPIAGTCPLGGTCCMIAGSSTQAYFNPLKFDSLDGVLTNFMGALQGIIVILAIIFIIIGAIMYITSGGSESRITLAKAAIGAAVLGLALAVAAPAFLKEIAGVLQWQDVTGSEVAGAQTFTQIGSKVLNFLLSIVGIIAIIMLVFGGFTYLTSVGDESKAEAGKKIVTYAIIALVVALSALILVTQIARFFA